MFRTFAISSNSLRVTSLKHFFALFTRFLTTLYDRSVNMSHPKLESLSIFRFSPFFLQSYIAQSCARDTKPSHSKLSSPHKLLHIARKKRCGLLRLSWPNDTIKDIFPSIFMEKARFPKFNHLPPAICTRSCIQTNKMLCCLFPHRTKPDMAAPIITTSPKYLLTKSVLLIFIY